MLLSRSVSHRTHVKNLQFLMTVVHKTFRNLNQSYSMCGHSTNKRGVNYARLEPYGGGVGVSHPCMQVAR